MHSKYIWKGKNSKRNKMIRTYIYLSQMQIRDSEKKEDGEEKEGIGERGCHFVGYNYNIVKVWNRFECHESDYL